MIVPHLYSILFFLTCILSLYMAFIYFTFLWSCYTYALCVSILNESCVDKGFHMFESHLHLAIQSLYLSVHITSLHTFPLLILLNSTSGYHAYFSRRKQILFHSLNLFSMNLLVATGRPTKQLITATASTCKFRNILTINYNTLLLIVEK